MSAADAGTGRKGPGSPDPQYHRLPPQVGLDETIASVDPDALPDPHAGRNVDQHEALRDD